MVKRVVPVKMNEAEIAAVDFLDERSFGRGGRSAVIRGLIRVAAKEMGFAIEEKPKGKPRRRR